MVFLLMHDKDTSRKILINPSAIKVIRPILVDQIDAGSLIEFKDKTNQKVEESFDEIMGSIDSDYGATSYS